MDSALLEQRLRRIEEAGAALRKHEMDGSIRYRLTNEVRVPRASGVYVIGDFRGPAYVGKSDNLRRRFVEHYEAEENPLLAAVMARPIGELRFAWVVTAEADQLERQLIRALDPQCNRIKYTNR